MPSNPLHCCRVCGLDHEYFIWGSEGHLPTFDICECCGVEFGYGDTTAQNCIDTANTGWAPKVQNGGIIN